MRRRNLKGRCEKRMIPKCSEVCKTYDDVQYAAAEMLSEVEEIKEIRCNVWLEGLGLEKEYTSDFVCEKNDGSLMVRECVFRKHIGKPMTAELLEASRAFWEARGGYDWGLIEDEAE